MAQQSKEQIIKVTLDIIAQEGIQKITIRRIAEEAGVNIASINYYFGSKEKLVEQSMTYFMTKMYASFEILQQKHIEPAQRLKRFLKRYGETTVSYPGVMKSLISNLMINQEINPELSETMQKGFEGLKATIKDISQESNDEILTWKALHVMSCLNYPVALNNVVSNLYGIDYENEDRRQKHLDLLFEQITRMNPN